MATSQAPSSALVGGEASPEPTPDDRVVAVEAGCDRLARGDFLAHVLVDQALELVLGRRPLPRPREPGGQGVDLAGCDHNAMRGRAPAPFEDDKQDRADRQELDQRFTTPATEHRALLYGVYQMADV